MLQEFGHANKMTDLTELLIKSKVADICQDFDELHRKLSFEIRTTHSLRALVSGIVNKVSCALLDHYIRMSAIHLS